MLKSLNTFALVGLILITFSACSSTQRNSGPEASAPESEVSDSTTASAEEPVQERESGEDQPPAAQSEAEKQAEEAKQAKERERKLAKLERELKTAKLKLSKTKMTGQHAQVDHDESIVKAEAELELARTKLHNLVRILGPQRIARAELDLQRAEDRFIESQQELEQLELMYSEEQFADQTKEIVIERAKRRLERAQQDLELRKKTFKTLIEVTIPLETNEQELGIQKQERALMKLRRDHECALIDQKVAVLDAEVEIIRLENELEDIKQEIQEAKAEPGR